MTRNLVYLAALSILMSGCIIVDEERVCEERPASAPAQAQAKRPAQALRHVVLLRCNEGTSAEDTRRIENAFSVLPGNILKPHLAEVLVVDYWAN